MTVSWSPQARASARLNRAAAVPNRRSSGQPPSGGKDQGVRRVASMTDGSSPSKRAAQRMMMRDGAVPEHAPNGPAGTALPERGPLDAVEQASLVGRQAG